MAEKIDYGFKMERSEPNKTEFEIQGSGVGGGEVFGCGCLTVLGCFMVFMIFGLIASTPKQSFDTGSAIFLSLILVGIYLLFIQSMKKKRQKIFKITIDESNIILDGKQYEKSLIGEVRFKAPDQDGIINSYTPSSFTVAGPAIEVAAMQSAHNLMRGARATGETIGKISAESYKKRNYSITFTYGQKEILVAQYLTEGQAASLFNEITKLI